MAGFTYKRNCFYIEAKGDVLKDPIAFTGYLHEKTFSSKEAFEKAINLDHEINHYVQELFIYGCISEGAFRDYLSAFARILSSVDGMRFPLANPENAAYNKSLKLEEEQADTLRSFYETLEVYNFIYRQAHIKPQTEEFRYGEQSDLFFSKHAIKYIHLIESYAFHKAYWDYFGSNYSGEGADLLHQLVVENNVYPTKWSEDGYLVENFKHNIEFQERYQLVNLMTIIGLPFNESNKEYLEYCEKEIPHNYMNSPSLFYNSAQRLTYETALNIPAVGFIMSSVTNGEYDKEVFSPVHRFYRILKNIRDFGGYPDAVPGEDFFITFFNWCAEQNGWPSYQLTYDSILSMLAKRAMKGQEAITNYQFNAVYRKNTHYGKYAQYKPVDTLTIHNLPLIVRSNERIMILQMMNAGVFDVSPDSDFYQVMFGTEEIIKFKPLTNEMDQSEMMKTVFQNGRAAIREILFRLFSGAAMEAYVYKGVFLCPLCEMGCPRACGNCEKFQTFDTVFENCQKNVLRFGPIKSYRPDGDGNIPDCMFFNYLLDYKFNILKIENGK